MRHLNEALRASGATDESAYRAAEEVAEFSKQVPDTRSEFANMRTDFAEVTSQLRVLQATAAMIAAGVAAIVIKTFFA